METLNCQLQSAAVPSTSIRKGVIVLLTSLHVCCLNMHQPLAPPLHQSKRRLGRYAMKKKVFVVIAVAVRVRTLLAGKMGMEGSN